MMKPGDHCRYERQPESGAGAGTSESRCTPRCTAAAGCEGSGARHRGIDRLCRRASESGAAAEVVIGLGCVPLADTACGNPALTEPMLPLIPKYDALMMANHGAVFPNGDVLKAYFKMETMEHFTRIQLVAERWADRGAGSSGQTPDSRTLRRQAGRRPSCPVAAEEWNAAVAHCRGTPRMDEEHFMYALGLVVEEALRRAECMG